MTFVDTNVFMCAVGGDHPLRGDAIRFLSSSRGPEGERLVTSAEVVQELLHRYRAAGRRASLGNALRAVDSHVAEVWSVEYADVRLACELGDSHAELAARDLIHLACCRRRDVQRIKTFDAGLAAAFGSRT